MTPDQLLEIIKSGESLDIEFKGEEKRPFSDAELVETVVCMANRSGDRRGLILVGVEDDGRLTGARARHDAARTDPLRVQALIANRTRPSLTVKAEVVSAQDCPVLIIEISNTRSPVGTADGRYLRRGLGGDGKPACLPFHFHEMQSFQADRGVLDYSRVVVPGATWKDLDPLELERFRRSIGESRGRGDNSLLDLPDLELARALGAIDADGETRAPSILGLLLFGRGEVLAEFLPTHEVAFQVLDGNKVVVNDFMRWPLLRVMEELESRFRARNREAELHIGMLRIGVPDCPERAFREGIANALIHRDYTRLGAVHVQLHQDQMEISNPGGFPEGVRLDNILVTPPRPRNPLLADAFKRAGIVERAARGIDTIFYEQLRNGRPAPSYDRSTETSVVLVLPGGAANLEFAKLVTEESQAERPLSLDELLILNQVWLNRRLLTTEAARVIQKPETDARARLERLLESGILESRGERKGRVYHLAGSTYRRLGDKSAYIRQRGFESVQQEQMVLQYVDKHGKITRREVAELCRLGPDQAYRLLKRLVRSRKLTLVGNRKGARYERFV
jgi:ATP-dependent DNA helicase RecG